MNACCCGQRRLATVVSTLGTSQTQIRWITMRGCRAERDRNCTMVSRPSTGGCRVRHFTYFGDPVLQRPQANSQHLGSAFAIAVHMLEGELDIGLFDLREWLARPKHYGTLVDDRRPGIRVLACTERWGRKVHQPDQTLTRNDGGSFENIP